jgi:hypothetical protein
MNVTSSASYSIDNGTLYPFVVSANNSTDQWAYFQSLISSPGPHRLLVEYNGPGDNGVPLILDHFIVQNITIPPPSTPNTVNGTRLSGGTIAGVVIGSLVGLALIIFILIWFIKGRRKAAAGLPLEPVLPMAAYDDGK